VRNCPLDKSDLKSVGVFAPCGVNLGAEDFEGLDIVI
jgi:hypothetical protein